MTNQHTIDQQFHILNGIVREGVIIDFHECKDFPTIDEINSLVSKTESFIESLSGRSDDQEKSTLFIEILLVLKMSLTSGVLPEQSVQFTYEDYDNIETKCYKHCKIPILKIEGSHSHMLRRLLAIRLGSEGQTKVFQLVNENNAISCINILFVLNGIDYCFDKNRLKRLFGQIFYNSYFCIFEARQFLMQYFNCWTFNSLLEKLDVRHGVFDDDLMFSALDIPALTNLGLGNFQYDNDKIMYDASKTRIDYFSYGSSRN